MPVFAVYSPKRRLRRIVYRIGRYPNDFWRNSARKISERCLYGGLLVHLTIQQVRATICRILKDISIQLRPVQFWILFVVLFSAYVFVNNRAFQWFTNSCSAKKRSKKRRLSRIGAYKVNPDVPQEEDIGRRNVVFVNKMTRSGKIYGF